MLPSNVRFNQRMTSFGAYGLRIAGLEDAPESGPVPQWWTHVTVGRSVGSVQLHEEYVTEKSARMRLSGGRGALLANRNRAVARYITQRRLRDEELVHPYLSPLALVWSRWLGRDTFHSGAFVYEGGVWAITGERGAGKSSTLASLSQMGIPILCDDVLVVDGLKALAGPRSIDLRPDAARHLAAGEPLGVIGSRERWRLRLAAVEPELPLCGWIFLRWGSRPGMQALRPGERLVRMGGNRSLRLPPQDPAGLLRLAALPSWELTRPQTWDSMQHTAELILETVG